MLKLLCLLFIMKFCYPATNHYRDRKTYFFYCILDSEVLMPWSQKKISVDRRKYKQNFPNHENVKTTINWLETFKIKESKGSSIWVNVAYILHGTIYSIFAYYMWTIQSNFRNLITSTTNVHRTWKNFIRHSTLAEKNIFVSIYSTTWPWCMELNPHRIFFC